MPSNIKDYTSAIIKTLGELGTNSKALKSSVTRGMPFALILFLACFIFLISFTIALNLLLTMTEYPLS